MSTTAIILLIAAGLGLLGGVFLVINQLERNKKKMRAQIGLFSERAHRFQRFLDYIPEEYVDSELRSVLLEETIRNLEKQAALDKGNEKLAAKIKLNKAALEENIKQHKPPQLPHIKDINDANDLRKRIMDLFKVVQVLQKGKKIDAIKAKKFLLQLKQVYVELAVAVHIMRAKQAEKENKAKLAIHFYNKASGEYRRNNVKGMFAAQLKELQKIIQQLSGKETVEERPSSTTRKTSEDDELSSAMEKFLEEEDNWKKKSF